MHLSSVQWLRMNFNGLLKVTMSEDEEEVLGRGPSSSPSRWAMVYFVLLWRMCTRVSTILWTVLFVTSRVQDVDTEWMIKRPRTLLSFHMKVLVLFSLRKMNSIFFQRRLLVSSIETASPFAVWSPLTMVSWMRLPLSKDWHQLTTDTYSWSLWLISFWFTHL